MQFSNYLKQQLTEQSISQATLSKHLKLSESTISLWLSGKRQPDWSNLHQVIAFFARSKTKQKEHLYQIFFQQ